MASKLSPPARLQEWHGHFVRVAGEVASAIVETHSLPDKVDHVWIDLLAGREGRLRLSLSTWSRPSQIAGFDPRVWVGLVRASWSELPAAGVFPSAPLDYGTFEAENLIEFAPYDRQSLEVLLLAKAGRADFVQAWGDFYSRGGQAGVHQIHSRRSSFAVPINHTGRDGAVEFYYREENTSETLLLKFAGQS